MSAPSSDPGRDVRVSTPPCERAPEDPSAHGVLRPAERIVETLALPLPRRPGPGIAPLPVPALEPLVDSGTTGFALVRVDASGAVASRTAVTLLGWSAGMPIRYEVRTGLIVVNSDLGAGRRVPEKLNLVLPKTIRARCRIRAGDQLLLAALVEYGLLVIYPQRRLYDMVIAYHEALQAQPGHFPNRRGLRL